MILEGRFFCQEFILQKSMIYTDPSIARRHFIEITLFVDHEINTGQRDGVVVCGALSSTIPRRRETSTILGRYYYFFLSVISKVQDVCFLFSRGNK